jgi:hypothetical protein
VASTRSPRSDVPVDEGRSGSARRRTHWTGLIGFGAFLMLMVGLFQAIEGLVAILNSDFYKVRPNGLVLHVNYTVWGWAHLLIGIAIFLAGLGVLSGNVVARTVGVVLAAISVVVNMLFLTAAPAMVMIIVLVDVFVMYALIVHGHEMEY